MSKEGSKYIFLLISVAIIVCGALIIQPFPWLRAGEREISGQIDAGDKLYEFSGDMALIISDLREVQGVAVAADDVIYFDQEGAEVYIDQLGYWYGQAYSAKLGWIEFDVQQDKIVKLVNGQLDGMVAAEDGTILKFTGESNWDEFDLAEIQVSDEMVMAVNSKRLIDPKILGYGQRNLYDVQIKWSTRDSSISVDEYGYVTATKKGVFKDAVVMRVGDEEKAITLQVIPTNQIDSYEPRVVTTDRGSVVIRVVFEAEVDKVTGFRLVKGASESKVCTLSGATENVTEINANCNFGDEDTGFWNIAIDFDGSEQVYTDSINVLGTQNTLNVTATSAVTFEDAFGFEQDAPDRSVFTDNEIAYDLTITFPSFIVGNGYSASDADLDINVKGVGRTDVCLPEADDPPEWCDGLGVYAPDNVSFCGPEVAYTELPGTVNLDNAANRDDINTALSDTPGRVTFEDALRLTYDDIRPQGCDFIVELTVTIDLDNGVKLQGTATVSNPIRKQKQVYLESDVFVETGGIEIRQINPDQSLYTLTAGDEIRIGADGERYVTGQEELRGVLEEYETSEDALFDLVIASIRGRVNELVAERGALEDIPSFASLASEYSDITRFGPDDRAKMPEGRIWYYNEGAGEVQIGGGGDDPIIVCAPTTLIVEGRDVVIQNDVFHAPHGDINVNEVSGPCVSNGKFGLIVLDGDIYVDGEVTELEGFYFTTGTLYTGISANRFVMRGVAIAHDFVLQRY